MASPVSSSFLITSILLLICFLSLSSSSVNGLPGGITDVRDVKTNKKVQELGKYSVGEYNQKFKKGLTFKEVVQAKVQVVEGQKYYLKVSATENGKPNLYDAVVVVQVWRKPSNRLVSFNPSS